MDSLQQFTADHRYLVDIVAKKAGLADPVLFDAGESYSDLLKNAQGQDPLPVDGVLLRTWEQSYPQVEDGVLLGMRIWEIQGIRFAAVVLNCELKPRKGLNFLAVERRDYPTLRKIANQLAAQPKAQSVAPVMREGYEKLLWENTISFLEQENIERYQKYGLRAHRGVLLSGPPGNGKTMACRWIRELCRSRNWEQRLVTPDKYRLARQQGDVDDLFRVHDRGVIFLTTWIWPCATARLLERPKINRFF